MAGLGWVRLISQGVVANRQGARPRMTILECYYTRIRTLTLVSTSESTIKLLFLLIYHSQRRLFLLVPFATLSSTRGQWVFLTHLEEFSAQSLDCFRFEEFPEVFDYCQTGTKPLQCLPHTHRQTHRHTHTHTHTQTHMQIQKEKQRE